MSTTIQDVNLAGNYIWGQPQTLSVLIETYRPKIQGFIYSKVQDSDLTADLVQDTFFKVIKSLKSGKYQEEGKFLSWVMRIAHNLVIDHFRKLKRMPLQYDRQEFSIFSVMSDDSLSIEEDMIQDHITNKLHEIIKQLPQEQSEVVSLRIFKEMSFKEISEQTGVSINTALGRMRYALINIRKIACENHIDLLAS